MFGNLKKFFVSRPFGDDAQEILEAIQDLHLEGEQKDHFMMAMDIAHQEGFFLQDGAGVGCVHLERHGSGLLPVIHSVTVLIMGYPLGSVLVKRPKNRRSFSDGKFDSVFQGKEFMEYLFHDFDSCLQAMFCAFAFSKKVDQAGLEKKSEEVQPH